MVHQNTIKLADFGLIRKIEEVSKKNTVFGIIPYIDPKKFNESVQYTLNKKSDVYSIGVLLWEISSGHPPFKDEFYINLAPRILAGLREKVVPSTPEDYVKIYTGKYNLRFYYMIFFNLFNLLFFRMLEKWTR